MTRVAFLWHMHQPSYEDLVTGEHILPWVRLHALKDYYGMVALLREFPEIRVTFNLVPSLLTQLEAFAADRARDRYLDVGLKDAATLTHEDKAFMLRNFFHAQHQRMIEIYPRYAELLARRGTVTTDGQADAVARRFDVEELRDLQVWQKLAWIDPFYLEDDRIRGLVGKGRDFTEDDKATLRAVELELLNACLPAYRDAADRGQAELSTSPFYHPILPLLCDTDIYKRTHPDSALPRQRFRHPDDALEQLRRAVACHERLFGRAPVGLWPSEGSVSDDMVPLVAEAGFSWMATDELILARTLDRTLTRGAGGYLEEPELLYTPYQLGAEGARVACTFRDHALSDLIGFAYANWPAGAAADDFVSRLAEAGRRHAARTGGGDAVISIILDGENAWEHFEGGGRPFLRALYERLSHHPELRTITMAEACRHAGPELPHIFPGSWIDANFYIWIGHRDDQLAWGQLAAARDTLDAAAAAGVDATALARAREEVLIAEGSDWFWWYGDDHSSDHDAEFDSLFRRHLRNVYGLLQRPVPDELFVSNISTGVVPPAEESPTGLLTPTIDGEDTSYFEWVGAGLIETRDVAGAMHQADREAARIAVVRFGFDGHCLYLRLDGAAAVRDLFDSGDEIWLTFLQPEGLKVSVRAVPGAPGEVSASLWTRQAVTAPWVDRGPGELRAAAATILELAVPLAALGVSPGGTLSFVVTVTNDRGEEIERHPAGRPIEATVPDAWFESRNWTA